MILDFHLALVLVGTIHFEHTLSGSVSFKVFRMALLTNTFFLTAEAFVTFFCEVYSFALTFELTKTKFKVLADFTFHLDFSLSELKIYYAGYRLLVQNPRIRSCGTV